LLGLVRPKQGWPALESIVRNHFGACGEIRSVKIHGDKAFMFVKFVLRASAEFAKEHLANQV
jgi:RNA recognition motif-containing protein